MILATRRYFGSPTSPATESTQGTATHVIVGSVLEFNGKYLLIEESANGQMCLNQPAGLLEPGETPAEGAVRETYEKSGVRFLPQFLVGIYDWHSQKNATRYIRMAFTGPIIDIGDGSPRDASVHRVTWLTHAQATAQSIRHRSPFVLACIEDHIRGIRFPLDAIRSFRPQ